MRRSFLYKVLFYLFISVSIFFIIIRPNRFVNSVRLIFSYIFNPSFIFKPADYFNNIYTKIYSIIVASSRLIEVSNENLRLKSKMIFVNSLLEENKKLSNVISLKGSISYKGVFARIISINTYNPYLSAHIDKGKKDGINVYNPVVALINGRWHLIGRILEVYDNFSKMVFITAPNFSFIADTKKSRGLITSDGNNFIYKFIEGDLMLGDDVYSSKISLTFPPYLYVGSVKEIFINDDFKTAYIEAFKVKDIDVVYVIDFKPYVENLEE